MLQEDGVRTVFKDLPLAGHERSVVDRTITDCIAKSRQNSAPNALTLLLQFHICIMQEFVNACPEEKKDISLYCHNMRERKIKARPL